MIDEVAKLIMTRISTLPWVDRWGALAFKAKMNASLADETQSIDFHATYANETREECENGALMHLQPSAQLKSLTYALDQTGVRESSKAGYWTGRLRVLFWLNAPALGYEEQITCLACAEVLKLISGARLSSDILSVKIRDAMVLAKTTDNWPASMVKNRAILFVYPYDHFAIDIRYEFQILGCPTLEPKDPIVCAPL